MPRLFPRLIEPWTDRPQACALPIRLLQEMLHVCLEFSKQSFVLARIVSCPLRLLFLVFEKFSEKRIKRSCVE